MERGYMYNLQSSLDTLPRDLVSALPAEPDAQLRCAHAISSSAFEQLMSEAQQLRDALSECQAANKLLERRTSVLEEEMQEERQRAKQAVADKQRLVAEKEALIETVKRMNREVARLEQFRRNLLRQLQDDGGLAETSGAGPNAPSMAAVDVTTERLVQDVLSSCRGRGPDQGLSTGVSAGLAVAAASAMGAGAKGDVSGGGGSGSMEGSGMGSSGMPRGTSAYVGSPGRLADGGGSSASGAGVPNAGDLREGQRVASPGRFGSHLQQQHCQDGFQSPHKHASGGGGSAGKAAAPPSASGSPRIDGKEFFRQARSRLSYETFSSFLGAIKELNAGRTTRDDTLQRARQLFGAANRDLYALFEGLLSRHLAA